MWPKIQTLFLILTIYFDFFKFCTQFAYFTVVHFLKKCWIQVATHIQVKFHELNPLKDTQKFSDERIPRAVTLNLSYRETRRKWRL